MSNRIHDYIAGNKTAANWLARRQTLSVGSPDGWYEVFKDFFLERLRLRYLNPISILQDNGTFEGEGFSILAIQCSLIEFLESTAEGTSYRYVRRKEELREHEYSSSQSVFVSFLENRPPFSKIFNKASAQDFYVSVRCGLLHEARTKNGWRVWAESSSGHVIADVNQRIVYRNDFQNALNSYIEAYGKKLPDDSELQAAFIRKFDSLCK